MITAAQESNLSNAAQRSAKRLQDKVNPFVININDFRLMPNVQALRAHKDYRVYSGPADASLPERERWLAGALKQMPARIINSAADDVFDIGRASKEDLVLFANEQWGLVLSLDDPLNVLRKKVGEAAKKAEEAELA